MRSLFLSCLVALSLSLGGCGLRPLYASGAQGGVATMLADIDVAPIEGHAGWLVRNALRDRFVAAQGGRGEGNRFRLDVRLEDSITGFGVRTDDSVTRARRTLRARRSEEHTSELQSLLRLSYAVFCLKKKKPKTDKRIEM